MNKDDIRVGLEKIVVDIERENSKSLSLYSGISGILLFKIFYNMNVEKDRFNIDKDFEYLIDESFESNYFTFSNGKAGFKWLFSYLRKYNILDNDDYSNLSYDNFILEQASLKYFSKNNYDFLHGGLGISYYSLYNSLGFSNSYFDKIYDELFRLVNLNTKYKMFFEYDFDSNKHIRNSVNFGLFHGCVSVLKFCIESFKKDVCKERSKEMAYKINDFLLNKNYLDQLKHSFYPQILNKDEIKPSRLGWCYGDLSLGYVLYQAGLVFKDTTVIDFSLKILKLTTTRRENEVTKIFDAGICHGTAGVAHIYNKLAILTNDVSFEESSKYWIEQTIQYSSYNDGIGGYKRFNAYENIYERSPGLLEGTAGIGLVLSSYLSGNFDWDYCIMLNE